MSLAEEQQNCENPEETQQNAERQWEEDAEEESFECFSPDSPLSDKSLRWSSEHAEEPSGRIYTNKMPLSEQESLLRDLAWEELRDFAYDPYDDFLPPSDENEKPEDENHDEVMFLSEQESLLRDLAWEKGSPPDMPPLSPPSEDPVESEKAGELSQPSSSQQIPSDENHGEVPGTQKKRLYSELSTTTHQVPGQSDSASSAARWQSDPRRVVVHSAPSAENHEDPGKICCLSKITMRIGTAVITMNTQTVLEPDHPMTVPQQGLRDYMTTTSWTRQPPCNEEHRRLMRDLMALQRKYTSLFTEAERQRIFTRAI